MALTIYGNVTAIATNLTASYLGVGGTPPYAYSVLPLGAGGIINALTGVYTSPAVVPSDPSKLYDTIVVTDATSATASVKVLVGSPLLLFCEILQNQLGLANDHIYLWDQKIFQPTDSSMYIAVGITSSKPFGNTNYWNGTQSIQSVNMLDVLSVDVLSRGPEARDRKAEVVMALNSTYAESQQELNSFRIGILPAGGNFTNLSYVDGAAIPYRFQLLVNLQYFATKVQLPQYYDNFPVPQVTTNP